MKRFAVLTVIFGIALFGAATGSGASSLLKVKAHVPFPFQAGSVQLPAGEYVFDTGGVAAHSASGSAVLIRRASDGAVEGIFASSPMEIRRLSAPVLLFHKYGNNYFLRKVRVAELEAGLWMSRAEREILVAGGREKVHPTEVVQASSIK